MTNPHLIRAEHMANNRAVIDFGSLPAPTVIEPLDFETVLSEIKADVLAQMPDMAATLSLESEPVTKLCQAFAYRTMQERQRANEKARRILLAQAKGPELDHMGALPWVRTLRKTLKAADTTSSPPLPAVMEADDDYRERLQLALEGWSTAGPSGAYIYHALGASDKAKDVAVATPKFARHALGAAVAATLPAGSFVLSCVDTASLSDPVPGDVAIAVLSAEGDGTADDALVQCVQDALSPERLRPTTDRPRAIAAQVLPYTVQAVLWLYPGPDGKVVLDLARAAVQAYAQAHHRCGHDIAISGLHQALHQPGVQKVDLIQPSAHIAVAWHQAAWCSAIRLTLGGVDV